MAPSSRNVGLNIVFTGDPRNVVKASKVVRAEVQGLGGVIKGVASGAAFGFAGAAVVRWGRESIQTYRTVGGEMLKLKRLTGGSEAFTSGLWVGAQQSGVAVNKLSTAIGLLSSKLNSKAVADLGIDLKTAAGQARPFEDVLREIMDRFHQMADGPEKNLLAKQLFGRSGTDLIPLLNRGSQFLDEMIAKGQKLGLDINLDDIKEATKNQRDFSLAVTATKVVIGKELLPLVNSLMGTLARNLPTAVAWIDRVGGAFNAIPGPLKLLIGLAVTAGPAVAVLGKIATPLKMTFSLLGSGRAAVDGFRLGLMGITEKGAGASNMLGGLINTIGPSGVAAGVAGLGLLAVAVAKIQMDAQHAKQNVSELQQLIESGLTPTEAGVQKLANTIAGVDGGFAGLGGSSATFAEDLRNMGLSASDAARVLSMTDKEWSAFRKNLRDEHMSTLGIDRLIGNLGRMREQTDRAATSKKIQKQVNDELGVSEGDLAGQVEETASAYDKAVERLQAYKDRQEKRISTARALADAEQATRDALAELAKVQETAAGRGEEVAQAEDAVTSAHEREAEAAKSVADANRRLDEAQQSLNEAYATAAERLRDKALADREAQDAAAGAVVDAERARKELERARSGGADKVTVDEKVQAVREADTAVATTREKARQAAAENAAAQRAGIEGDEEVVRAKQAVKDATESVTAAERQQADAREATAAAEANVAKVISDAKGKIAAATRKLEDAMLSEAGAADDAATAQHGAAAGAKAHADRLRELRDILAPGSELRTWLDQYIADLERAGLIIKNPDSARVPPTRNPDDHAPPGGNNDNLRGGGRQHNIETHVHISGTSAEQRRNFRETADELGNEIARAVG